MTALLTGISHHGIKLGENKLSVETEQALLASERSRLSYGMLKLAHTCSKLRWKGCGKRNFPHTQFGGGKVRGLT